jgi:NAD(P)-dependent dehydrogenase (short-subunit alcohol dehydrogenase family)
MKKVRVNLVPFSISLAFAIVATISLLAGVFQCSQGAADQMIRQGTGGSIINVS